MALPKQRWRNARIGTYSDVSLNFPSISAGSQQTLTVSFPQVKPSDTVIVTAQAPASGIDYDAYVSQAGVVTVRAINNTAGSIDPAAALFNLSVLRG